MPPGPRAPVLLVLPPVGEVEPHAAMSPGAERPAAAAVARLMNVLRLVPAPAMSSGSLELTLVSSPRSGRLVAARNQAVWMQIQDSKPPSPPESRRVDQASPARRGHPSGR